MQNTENLSFKFEQNINGKVENGNCIIQYPKKIVALSYVKDLDQNMCTWIDAKYSTIWVSSSQNFNLFLVLIIIEMLEHSNKIIRIFKMRTL